MKALEASNAWIFEGETQFPASAAPTLRKEFHIRPTTEKSFDVPRIGSATVMECFTAPQVHLTN